MELEPGLVMWYGIVVRCEVCNGTGVVPHSMEDVRRYERSGDPQDAPLTDDCPDCC